MKNDSYFIIDYKTAKYEGTQDSLLPMYEVQLNSYAYIGNSTAFNPVSGIGLIYYEPITDITTASIDALLVDGGFQLTFSSHLHALELDPDGIIPPLLQKVRDIFDNTKAPERLNGCEDCEKLDRLINFAIS